MSVGVNMGGVSVRGVGVKCGYTCAYVASGEENTKQNRETRYNISSW